MTFQIFTEDTKEDEISHVIMSFEGMDLPTATRLASKLNEKFGTNLRVESEFGITDFVADTLPELFIIDGILGFTEGYLWANEI